MLLRRHAFLLYAVVAAVLAAFVPLGLAAVPIAVLGVLAFWVSADTWSRREQLAGRAQSLVLAIGVISLSMTTPGSEQVGLFMWVMAGLFLLTVHTVSMALRTVQASLVTVGGFSRVQGARDGLFTASFAVPAAVVFLPGIIGVVMSACLVLGAMWLGEAQTRLRLQRGMEAAGAA